MSSKTKSSVFVLNKAADYSKWAKLTVILLQTKEVWVIVNGKESKPVVSEKSGFTEKDVRDWIKNDDKAKGLIGSTLHSTIYDSLKSTTPESDASSKTLWEEIKTRYGGRSEQDVTLAFSEYIAYTYNPSMGIENFTRNWNAKVLALSQIGHEIDTKAKLLQYRSATGEYFMDIQINNMNLDLESYQTKLIDYARTKDLYKNLASRKGGSETLATSGEGTLLKRDGTAIKCFNCGGNHLKKDCRKPPKANTSNNNNASTSNNSNTSNSQSHQQRTKRKTQPTAAPVNITYEWDAGEMSNVVESEESTNLLKVSSEKENLPSRDWIIDTGSSEHIVRNEAGLKNIRNVSSSITGVVKGVKLAISKAGDLDLGGGLMLSGVLVAPNSSHDIISAQKLVRDKRLTIVFSPQGSQIIRGKSTIVGAAQNEIHNLVQPRGSYWSLPQSDSKKVDGLVLKVDYETLHRRLGHMGKARLDSIIEGEYVTGIDFDGKKKKIFCSPCEQVKSHRLPFPTSTSRASDPLELVHLDLAGPLGEGKSGENYFLLITDDCTRYRFLIPLATKEVYKVFSQWLVWAEKITGYQLKKTRSDRGGEFTGNVWKELKNRGVTMEFSMAYTPEQNGVAERGMRTVKESGDALLRDAGMDVEYWPDAYKFAVYLLNRSPTSTLPKNITPFEALFHKKPNLSMIRIWGSKCTVRINSADRTKQAGNAKGKPGIFVGIPSNSKGWIVELDEDDSRVESRDVSFWEGEFMKWNEEEEEEDEEEEGGRPRNYVDVPKHHPQLAQEIPPAPPLPPQAPPKPEGLRINPKPSEKVIENRAQGVCAIALAASLEGELTPFNYQAAIKSVTGPKWRKAVGNELENMKINNVFEVVDIQKGMKILPSHFVFALKLDDKGDLRRDSTGMVDGQKARLVAGGNFQEEGIDFFDIYAPTSRQTSIRIVLSEAAKPGMLLMQADIKGAYLNAPIDVETFIRIPKTDIPDLENLRNNNKCWRLIKALYGLHQGGSLWWKVFAEKLVKRGFRPLEKDPAVYVYRDGNKVIYVPTYVDDFIAATNWRVLWDKLLTGLIAGGLKLSKDGPLDYFLGSRITKIQGVVYVSQSGYIKEVVRGAGLADANGAVTPYSANSTRILGGELLDTSLANYYRKVHGQLNWINNTTRPDISYALKQVSAGLSAPTIDDLKSLKRIVKYLKETSDYGIRFVEDGLGVVAYSDADYAADSSRRSRTGTLVWRNGPVNWHSILQKQVSLSTMEAEYIALGTTALNLVDVAATSEELFSLPHSYQLPLFCDNESAIRLSDHHVNSSRSRHIDIRCHFVRQLQQEKKIKVTFVSSQDNKADILTKALSNEKFIVGREKLGVVKIPLEPKGGC